MTVAISAGQFPRSLLRRGVTSYPVIHYRMLLAVVYQACHLREKFSSRVENLMLAIVGGLLLLGGYRLLKRT